MSDRTVLALCGSLRTGSLHAALIAALERRAHGLRFVGADVVRDLPLYNADLDAREADAPPLVRAFRALASAADAIVISSPEYLHAPSGVTKNALDWLIGAAGLIGKPALVMSASPGNTGGLRGVAGLLPTLELLGLHLVDPVTVPHAHARIRPDGLVLDDALDLRLEIAIEQLAAALPSPAAAPAPQAVFPDQEHTPTRRL